MHGKDEDKKATQQRTTTTGGAIATVGGSTQKDGVDHIYVCECRQQVVGDKLHGGVASKQRMGKTKKNPEPITCIEIKQ